MAILRDMVGVGVKIENVENNSPVLSELLKRFRTVALVGSQGGMNESFRYVKSGDPNMTVSAIGHLG